MHGRWLEPFLEHWQIHLGLAIPFALLLKALVRRSGYFADEAGEARSGEEWGAAIGGAILLAFAGHALFGAWQTGQLLPMLAFGGVVCAMVWYSMAVKD